jgi:hypothetical protein
VTEQEFCWWFICQELREILAEIRGLARNLKEEIRDLRMELRK